MRKLIFLLAVVLSHLRSISNSCGNFEEAFLKGIIEVIDKVTKSQKSMNISTPLCEKAKELASKINRAYLKELKKPKRCLQENVFCLFDEDDLTIFLYENTENGGEFLKSLSQKKEDEIKKIFLDLFNISEISNFQYKRIGAHKIE